VQFLIDPLSEVLGWYGRMTLAIKKVKTYLNPNGTYNT